MNSASRLIAVVALGLLAAACTPDEAIELTGDAYLEEVEGTGLPLDDRVPLPRLDSEIAYPEGWHAESGGPFTTITWDRSEETRWFAGDDLEGPLVFFEVETFDFMRGMGLEESPPTPAGLLEFGIRTFGWEDVRDELSVSLFGGEGVQVRGLDPRGEFLAIQGVLPDERTILIMVIAPTSEDLDELLPTWRDMVGTIQDEDNQEA